MGDGWSAAVHPDDRAWVSRAWHDAAGGRGSFNGEYRFQRPDGRVTWVVGTAAAAWDEQGEFLGHVGTITDITERRQTEERLRASEARFRGLIDSSPVPYALNDAALRITYLNPAFVRMFGYDRHDIPTVDDWWPRAYPDEGYRRRVEADWMERLDRSRRDGGTFEPMEVKIRCKDGADRVAVVSPHAIGDGLDGTYAVVLHDVTERRQLEEARLRSQRLESLGTLAGGVAHDFNNILTAIVGHTELAIADADPNSPVGEALAAVHVASLRAVELVRRITSFAGPKERSPTSLQLGHVVEEVLRLLRSTTSPSISLRTVFARDVPAARADAAQVHEALVNLTTNAVYAIGSRPGQIEYLLDAVDVGGTTAARLGLTPGAYVRLTVKDDGVGIDPAALGRIFDAFFTTKPTGQGSGLGLSMVYGIMKGHDGAVDVESARGVGTSFVLYFPTSDTAAATSRRPQPPARAVPGTRVLHVDDEPSVASVITRGLTRLGHVVSSFTDPREALDELRRQPHQYDVLLTDLAMPHISGLDLAAAVLAIRPDLRIVITTGHAAPEEVARCQALGIHEVVAKPPVLADLSRAIAGRPGDG
jgi:PAS domain S-box-containing protein